MTCRRLSLILIGVGLILVTLGISPFTFHGTEIKYFLLQSLSLIILLLFIAQKFFISPADDALRKEGSFILLLVYFSLNWASLIWSEYRLASSFRALSLSFYLLWAVLVLVTIKREQDLAWFLRAYLGAGLLAALVALIYYLGFSKTRPLAQPWHFPTGNRDFLAGLLLVPLGIAFARAVFHFFRKKNWKRGLAFSGLSLFLLIIFGLTGSKAGILGLAVVFFVVLLFILPRQAKVAITLAAFIMAGSALLIYKSFPPASQWLHSKYAYRSLRQRYYFWDWSLRMVSRKPLLGWGAGTFVAANGPFSSIDRFRYLHEEGPYFLFADATVHSHNEFLEVLVELGVVGLGVYLLLLLWVGIKGATGSKTITGATTRFSLYGLFGGFIGLCVQSFFSVGLRYWDLAPYFWACVGALLAAGSLRKTEKAPYPASFSIKGKHLRLVIFLVLVSLAAFFWYLVGWKGFTAQMDLYEADVLRIKGEYARAVPYYRKAKEDAFIYADLLRGQYALGKILLNFGRWQEARDTLETVNSLAADFIYTNYFLGEVYDNLGEKEKALTYFRRYQRQNPYDQSISRRIEALVRENRGGEEP
ncbi:MAG: hypothetical protein AMS15_01925 [Planctomycetes bacterium DG_23]|nr:MAG: hypothetical protein AMS15_01925 [Planctomycetes bacterium DG_23]